MAVVTLLLTALILAGLGFGAAELVRSTCRRQLAQPVRVRAVRSDRAVD